MSGRPVSQLVLRSFEGTEAPQDVLDRIESHPPAGFTLFRGPNIGDPEQVRHLTRALQQANPMDAPLLIATDQEGGQLQALAGATDFPGNMALGAAGDPALTEEVGAAIARELDAVGVNVNYAPVADLSTKSGNPSLGIRSFGDRPGEVSRHVARFVEGSRSVGVHTVLKHFPGKGEARVDSHYRLPVLAFDRRRLDDVELVPFRAGIAAGAALVMTGHFAVPGLTESDDLPSTLSPAVLDGLLRGDLGFGGAIVTDAFDMGAIAQGGGQVIDAIAAIRAGVDLLLLNGGDQVGLEAGLDLAVRRGLVSAARYDEAIVNTTRLRSSVSVTPDADLDVLGSERHRELARRVAERSITLVRDREGLLPLRPSADTRIAAVMPTPTDRTPADTSSYTDPLLAESLRRHHRGVDEFVPTEESASDVVAAVAEHDLVIVGTISAHLDPWQLELVEELLGRSQAVVTVALRTPYDLPGHPAASTHVCAYGVLPPTMEALADALFGHIPFQGRLPVAIADLYAAGHGLGHGGEEGRRP